MELLAPSPKTAQSKALIQQIVLRIDNTRMSLLKLSPADVLACFNVHTANSSRFPWSFVLLRGAVLAPLSGADPTLASACLVVPYLTRLDGRPGYVRAVFSGEWRSFML